MKSLLDFLTALAALCAIVKALYCGYLWYKRSLKREYRRGFTAGRKTNCCNVTKHTSGDELQNPHQHLVAKNDKKK